MISFTNPVMNGADPWFIKDDEIYYFCRSNERNQIQILASADLTEPGEPVTIWEAPEKGWNSRNIWAPELHRVKDRWYVYYAADNGKNENHRMGVLISETADPLGSYKEGKQIHTGGRWAIDGTLLRKDDDLYFIWSGWPGDKDEIQNLYIAPMSDPETVCGEPVMISTPEYSWEKSAYPINEGPQVLALGSKIHIIYSANASWTEHYCQGMLTLKDDGDPMNRGDWIKERNPVIQGTKEVLGIGHVSFVKSPDDRENWIAYHAKKNLEEGWDRDIRLQQFTVDHDYPVFGQPFRAGIPLAKPSGTK